MSTALSGFRLSRRAKRALVSMGREGSPSQNNRVTTQSDAEIGDAKGSCRATTTAALQNGAAQTAATLAALGNDVYRLTADNVGALANCTDGVALVAGDRLLVQNQVATGQNGYWFLVQQGTAALPWIIQRTEDGDSAAKVSPNSFCGVEEGTLYADTYWAVNANSPITMDADGLLSKDPAFAQTIPTGVATLAVLASNANGEGASLIGIEDPGLNFTATTVEGALAELRTKAAGTTGVGGTAVLWSMTLADDTAYLIEGNVVARSVTAVGGGDENAYSVSALVSMRGGVPALGGAGVASLFTDEEDVTWACTLALNVNDIELQVTGDAADAVNWVATLTYTAVA
jgi:hypothetical protein